MLDLYFVLYFIFEYSGYILKTKTLQTTEKTKTEKTEKLFEFFTVGGIET